MLPAGDKLFYDFETTQNKRYSDGATLLVPNPVCVHQFNSRCENLEDVERNCVQCGKRKHLFWDETVGGMLSYLSPSVINLVLSLPIRRDPGVLMNVSVEEHRALND